MSAGEISGDFQAAHLAGALLRADPTVKLYGCGGERMREAGVDVRILTAHLGYVGVHEALPFRRAIKAAHRALDKVLEEDRPDIVVLVDGERFNRPVIDLLHRKGIPFVYYFVPQVWFWGRWRTRHIARHARLVVPAFPKEREIFGNAGANVEWLGHPLIDLVRISPDSAGVVRSLGLDDRKPVIGLMPGSRMHEVESFTPIVLEAAKRLKASHPNLQFILPLAARHLRPQLERHLATAGLDQSVTLVTTNRYDALSRCELVLLSSGTATLETALLGVPMVVFYRMRTASYLAARTLVKTPHIAMPNILLGREVVPELFQTRFTAENLVQQAEQILDNPERVKFIREQLASIPAMLGTPGVLDRVAGRVLHQIASQASERAPQPKNAALAVA